MRVIEEWDRLRKWLSRHAPATDAVLRPGASEAALGELEERLGMRFPVDLRAWWTCCNGAKKHEFAEILPPFYTPYDTEGCYGSYSVWMDVVELDMRELQPEAHAGGAAWKFHEDFVPIAFDGCGNDLVVDLRPGPLRGCVLEWEHERGSVDRPLFSSLGAMLDAVNEALYSGTPVAYCLPTLTSDGRLGWQTR